ncbi:MAG TPA: DUF222 domain-containing protein [Acidimicrobiia bacterium]|nr:DUF222 domain-containing protein [Acidimicrobiia bacterium]
MSSTVAELAERLGCALREFDPGCSSSDECAELAELLAKTANACETASARAAARAAACGEHTRRGRPSAAEWMAKAGGTSTAAARSALKTLEQLRERPELHAELLSGEVSLSQAREIVDAPVEHERELAELARRSGLRPVQDAARAKRLADIDPDELHARQHTARAFVHWRDRLGMVRFRGALPPEQGVAIVNRLDAETDRVWRETRGSDRSRSQCAADACVRMLEGKGRGNGRTADMVVVVNLDAYRRGHAHAGEQSHVIGGGPIPVSVARALAKDAFLKVVLHDGVKIHTVKHFGRYRPAALETALTLGHPPAFDGVACSEPGCERQYGLQWDHIDPVSNDGLTSEENVRPYCTPHHVEKTERDRAAGRLRGQRPKRKRKR